MVDKNVDDVLVIKVSTSNHILKNLFEYFLTMIFFISIDQINASKIVFRRSENDPDPITEEFLLQKAHELTSLEEILKTQIIKKKQFIQSSGRCPVLFIATEKKKKDKKKKRKNVENENDVDSKAVQ